MDSLSVRALLILGIAFVLSFAVFSSLGTPMAEGGTRPDSSIFATIAAGTYALTSLAAIVFARGVLGLFVDFSRPVAFFRALGAVTDPFMALFAPITPAFLHEAMHPFYAAFCLYFIKFFIFGGFGAPPPWLLLLFILA
ncbi:MAG TPA: hypothetical protein VMM59_11050 [Thermohalobaculum sp.]|nr:hypothetical protein [Thermohalobaculum sp.]